MLVIGFGKIEYQKPVCPVVTVKCGQLLGITVRKQVFLSEAGDGLSV